MSQKGRIKNPFHKAREKLPRKSLWFGVLKLKSEQMKQGHIMIFNITSAEESKTTLAF